MKITGIKTEEVTIDVNEKQLWSILKTKIKEFYEIDESWFLKDGKIYFVETWHGHKTEFNTVYVKDVSERELEGFNLLNVIDKL